MCSPTHSNQSAVSPRHCAPEVWGVEPLFPEVAALDPGWSGVRGCSLVYCLLHFSGALLLCVAMAVFKKSGVPPWVSRRCTGQCTADFGSNDGLPGSLVD
uniref:Uncharacterized protein n=1 Tax=Eutreptiella gymnastica TaxID=73025 RepID=A0A6T2I5L4_9EUGL|mmetsp:Transcript_100237/g.169293  ORF Transcript_100237/g.169293 Transcript_100237/m.169293 type:complete len:100 (+) Transcript_100237:276-575(+)